MLHWPQVESVALALHPLAQQLAVAADGFGPFDSMFLFARGLASYDCIYSRACGLWNSADSYGGAHRKVVRQPASLNSHP